MPFAIRFHQTGGPEVLCLEEVEIGAPAPGEARNDWEIVVDFARRLEKRLRPGQPSLFAYDTRNAAACQRWGNHSMAFNKKDIRHRRFYHLPSTIQH